MEILKQWIDLGRAKNDLTLVENRQKELIILMVGHGDYEDAAKVYLELNKKGILLEILALE